MLFKAFDVLFFNFDLINLAIKQIWADLIPQKDLRPKVRLKLWKSSNWIDFYNLH